MPISLEQIRYELFPGLAADVPVKDHIPAGIDGRLGGRASFCLHLWRPQNADIPRPPIWMIDAIEVSANA